MSYPVDIYVLILEDGYWYVGKSKVLDKRLRRHLRGRGSAWTKLHPYTGEAEHIFTFECESPEDEDKWENHVTIKMMKEKGWKNVRGGFWSNTDEIQTLKGLHHHNYFLDIAQEQEEFATRTLTVFALRLEQGKYFIGYTFTTLQQALKKYAKGKGSEWVKRFPPIEIIPESTTQVSAQGEIPLDAVNDMVIEYGRKYGFENVRGGNFVCLEDGLHIRIIESHIKHKEKPASV